MVRVLFLVMVIVTSISYGQEGKSKRFMYMPEPTGWRVPGLISASATYAPSVGVFDGRSSFHLHAFAEYHISNRVSVKSDSYWFLNSNVVIFSEDQMLRSYFGMFYHLNGQNTKNWDVKIGLQPGLTYLKRRPWIWDEVDDEYSTSYAPSLSASIGFDYYVWKYFHFFSQVSYLHSNVRNLEMGSRQMDEIVFSLGLGFQIPTRRN